jgi:hypothetical protein
MSCLHAGRLFIMFAVVCAPSLAGATAQRTFVSGTGVDNPTCSLCSPCRQFVAAVSATTTGGEVIVLDSAGYGTVTIAKSITLAAPPGVYAGVSVISGSGITINGGGIVVTLRGLTIKGQGGSNGIAFTQGAELNIAQCEISNMTAAGIVVTATSSNLTVRDTVVRDNGVYGISISGAGSRAALDALHLTNNATAGLYALGSVAAYVTDSVIYRNGIGLQGGGPAIGITTIVSSHNKISGNGIGIKADAMMGLVYALLDGNLLSANTTAVSINPGTTVGLTYGNNVYANNSSDGSTLLSQTPK